MKSPDHGSPDSTELPQNGPSRRTVLGALAGGAAMLAQPGLSAAAASGEAPELAALDKMATRPATLAMAPRVTYLGGPTYLVEIGRFRIVTDPGFDPQGTWRSEGPGHVLTKVMAPPIPVDKIGQVDLVLLSHAQHLDNLDNAGRSLLAKVGTTITTPASAAMKLPGKRVKGLATWESTEVSNAAGERLKVTGMPGVHTSNPDLREAVGEVMGFMLEWEGQPGGPFYISGDTVWIDEIHEIAKRFTPSAGILHLGAANVPAVGENYLTMSSVEGARVTKALGLKRVYPAHFEGWRHFSQGSWSIEREFEKAGLTEALVLLRPGESRNVAV
jgi:L-ascorbate metabolism protein UlaG (beta-lactamase superfamily)